MQLVSKIIFEGWSTPVGFVFLYSFRPKTKNKGDDDDTKKRERAHNIDQCLYLYCPVATHGHCPSPKKKKQKKVPLGLYTLHMDMVTDWGRDKRENGIYFMYTHLLLCSGTKTCSLSFQLNYLIIAARIGHQASECSNVESIYLSDSNLSLFI